MYPRFYKSFGLDIICCPRFSSAFFTLLCALGKWATCATSIDNFGLSHSGVLTGNWKKGEENPFWAHREVPQEPYSVRLSFPHCLVYFSVWQLPHLLGHPPLVLAMVLVHYLLWAANTLLPLLERAPVFSSSQIILIWMYSLLLANSLYSHLIFTATPWIKYYFHRMFKATEV